MTCSVSELFYIYPHEDQDYHIFCKSALVAWSAVLHLLADMKAYFNRHGDQDSKYRIFIGVESTDAVFESEQFVLAMIHPLIS